MIEREHFKTCVRAYFPEHDFYWLDGYPPVDYVACNNFCELTSREVVPDEEQTLLRILRPYANRRICDPRTLTFGGERLMLSKDNDTDIAIVFVLKDIKIDSYASQFFHPFY
jgi:hypothetical protein